MSEISREHAAGSREYRGFFIALEGGDGAGKSTQSRLLAERFRAAGRDVLTTREPGGTPIGEKLRSLVLDHGHGDIDARTEALMFAASRAAHAEQVLRPALREGKTVITDRYIDSSVAYQGGGRSLGTGTIRDLNAWATGGLWPDLTILLDVAPAAGRSRRVAGTSAEDRLESEPDDFHGRIRAAFLELAESAPDRYLVLDASRPAEELATVIGERVDELAAARSGEGSAR